jgi:predicted HicB family RNase H-like nuclease
MIAQDNLHIRIPHILKEALQEQAERESRSLTSLIIHALKQYMDAQGKRGRHEIG